MADIPETCDHSDGKRHRGRKRRRLQEPSRGGLPLSNLAGMMPGMTHIRAQVGLLRRQLERAVTSKYGGISIERAAAIQTCCRCERAAQIIERVMREQWTTLDVAAKSEILDRVARHVRERDRAIAALKIAGVAPDGVVAPTAGAGMSDDDIGEYLAKHQPHDPDLLELDEGDDL